MKHNHNSNGSSIPPAWNYNPSSWGQRIPLVIIAFVGFCIAMYLSFYQMHIIDDVWDPFFGKGTKNVLSSGLSKKFAVPDALLGAGGYLLDVITGIIGGVGRWKKMPWIVIIFGVAVGPLGLVSIFLVIAQPVIVGSWCFLCLCSAVISVWMISPAMDEMLASLQYLQRVKRKQKSVWNAFWGYKNAIIK